MAEYLNKQSEVISEMFNEIAPQYDFLNHLLSLDIDKLWRRKLVRNIKKYSVKKVLDLACGTGDLSILLAKNGYDVTGMDIAEKMLTIAEEKSQNLNKKAIIPKYTNASAEAIPYSDNSFDAVTISFGIRNFNNRHTCLTEIFRVLKPGSPLLILEFAEPRRRVWKALYLFYFKNILPLIGKMFSKSKSAYSYLPKSVLQFPQYEQFTHELSEAGFSNIRYSTCSGGIAILYIAER